MIEINGRSTNNKTVYCNEAKQHLKPIKLNGGNFKMSEKLRDF